MNELFAPTYKKNSGLISVAHTNWGSRFGGRGFMGNPHHRYVLGSGQRLNRLLCSDDPALDTPADILELFKHVDNVDGISRSTYRIDASGTHGFYAYIDTKYQDDEGLAQECIEQSLGLFVVSRFPEAAGIYIATEDTLGRSIIARAIQPQAA